MTRFTLEIKYPVCDCFICLSVPPNNKSQLEEKNEERQEEMERGMEKGSARCGDSGGFVGVRAGFLFVYRLVGIRASESNAFANMSLFAYNNTNNCACF